jgi:hypothetical protein
VNYTTTICCECLLLSQESLFVNFDGIRDGGPEGKGRTLLILQLSKISP